MDGVLSDTQKIHAKVESELFRELGINIPPEEMTRRFAGMSFRTQIRTLLKEYHKTVDIDEFELEKYEKYVEELSHGILAVSGAKPLVEWLSSKHIPMAVATTNKKKASSIVMSELGFDNFIKTVVTSEDIKKGKPAPDIFIKAAKLLQVPTSECVVIEDGESGIIGGKQAGMKTIGFGKDMNGKGDYSADSMDEVKEILFKIIN